MILIKKIQFDFYKISTLLCAGARSAKKNKEECLALTIVAEEVFHIPQSYILPIFFSDGLMERSERSALAPANSSPYDFYGKPFYGKTTTDVIVQEGSHAFFHCLVHNLGNQTVSIFFKSFNLYL